MKIASWSVGVVLGLAGFGLTACGGQSVAMPDVVGKKLNVAKNDIKDAGYGGGVDTDGGWIIMSSNWTVCEQRPAATKTISDKPRLTVARHCAGEATAKPSDASSDAAMTASATTTPTPTPTSTPTPVPAAVAPMNPATSADLKAVLKASDGCDDAVANFVQSHRGQEIEFDGSIADIAPGESNVTRYILISPGDDGPTGAAFIQLYNINNARMHLNRGDITGLANGKKVHLVARVERYDADQCLLRLEPVSTQFR